MELQESFGRIGTMKEKAAFSNFVFKGDSTSLLANSHFPGLIRIQFDSLSEHKTMSENCIVNYWIITFFVDYLIIRMNAAF